MNLPLEAWVVNALERSRSAMWRPTPHGCRRLLVSACRDPRIFLVITLVVRPRPAMESFALPPAWQSASRATRTEGGGNPSLLCRRQHRASARFDNRCGSMPSSTAASSSPDGAPCSTVWWGKGGRGVWRRGRHCSGRAACTEWLSRRHPAPVARHAACDPCWSVYAASSDDDADYMYLEQCVPCASPSRVASRLGT